MFTGTWYVLNGLLSCYSLTRESHSSSCHQALYAGFLWPPLEREGYTHIVTLDSLLLHGLVAVSAP